MIIQVRFNEEFDGGTESEIFPTKILSILKTKFLILPITSRWSMKWKAVSETHQDQSRRWRNRESKAKAVALTILDSRTSIGVQITINWNKQLTRDTGKLRYADDDKKLQNT